MTKRIVFALAMIAGCGVNVNGTRYGLGSTASAAPAEAPGDDPEFSGHNWIPPEDRPEPYATAPVDPWAGVDGDGPARIPAHQIDHLRVRDKAYDCTAVHDHCFLRAAWMVEGDGARDRDPTERFVAAYLFDPTGPVRPLDGNRGRAVETRDGYTAYRTVPATHKNLVKGALITALSDHDQRLDSAADVFLGDWAFGVVDKIDWAGGKVYLVGRKESFLLAWTRVAVLSWRPGGKVEILGGRARGELAVSARDVIVPQAAIARIADPWAEVGADKKPKPVSDDLPIEEARGECNAAHDHCLRPWVWFVESEGRARPGRFTGKAFAYAADAKTAIRDAGMAYRTVPATASNLAVGATVIVYPNTTPNSEHDALTEKWLVAKVAEVQGAAGLVKLAGDDDFTPLGRVRVAVVQWFPGEKAEKVP